MGKKKNKTPIINLIGNNSTEVVGSMIEIITTKGTKILLEMGGVQGGTVEEDYRYNGNALNNVDLNSTKYVFILHSHFDHLFLIPRAVKLGMDSNIISTSKTAKLMIPLLKDCAFINDKNAKYISEKYKKEFPSLYSIDDVSSTMNYVYEYEQGKIIKLDDEISFKLLKNNHVLGAGSLELYIKDEHNKTYKVFYSSDLGNVSVGKRPYLSEIEYCKKANVAIFESTYGNRDTHFTKKDRKKEIQLIKKEVVECCLGRNSSILIPCFSFSRSQEIMTILWELFNNDERFRDIEFIVDSKLTKNINKVYSSILEGEDKELFEKVISWKNFKFISDFNSETTQVLKDNRAKVIISSSGFCEAGHVVEYIRKYVENENATILFCGYASEKSLAGRLRKDTETITIDSGKKPYKKKCKIVTLETFSSHMQKKDLVDYICGMNCEKVILVHGDKDAKENLKLACEEKLREMCKTTNIIVGQKNLKVSM